MEEFGTTKVCRTCKLWIPSKTPAINTCAANSHIELTGPEFFCKNWEPLKEKKRNNLPAESSNGYNTLRERYCSFSGK
jgi:hypothetical protein